MVADDSAARGGAQEQHVRPRAAHVCLLIGFVSRAGPSMQAPAFGPVGFADEGNYGSFAPAVTTYAGSAFSAPSYSSSNLAMAHNLTYPASARPKGPPLQADFRAGGPHGAAVPAFLESTMEELRGERSVHGLNSGHSLLPVALGGNAAPPFVNGAPRHPNAFPDNMAGMPQGIPWSVGMSPNTRTGPTASTQPTSAFAPPRQVNGMEPFHGWAPGLPPMNDPRNGYAGQQHMPQGSGGGFNSFSPPLNASDMRQQRSAQPPREGPPQREFTNGFKDSDDYVKGGSDAESEFLSSRADLSSRAEDYPQIKNRRKGKRDDQLTCMPCFVSSC